MKNSAQVLFAFSAAVMAVGGCSSSSPKENPLVQGVNVTQIAAYQTLKTTLMKDGSATDAEVPIILGKALTLRAFAQPQAGWDGHPIIARFELSSGGATTAVDVNVVFTAESTESNLASTANLDLTADQVTSDLLINVSFREPKHGAPVESPNAAWPSDLSSSPLNAQDTGDGEHIVIVPVSYNADGSGRLPDMSDDQIAKLRNKMMALYPARTVDITVADPIVWNNAIQASGKGWGRLLQSILNMRLSANVPENVYYYGMFAPSASFEQFCTQGCVLGLSTAAIEPDDNMARGSIGVSYADNQAESDITFVHEIGHAHGREHSPCGGAADPDPDYPYANGGIGLWGYDFAAKVLWDPAGKARDMMGYCDPDWISDFTYKALYDRMRYLNLGQKALVKTSRFRSVVIGVDGEATRGDIVTSAPKGNERMVERFADDGTSEQFQGHYYPFDHIKGGILLVPEAQDQPGLGTLVFNGTVIQ